MGFRITVLLLVLDLLVLFPSWMCVKDLRLHINIGTWPGSLRPGRSDLLAHESSSDLVWGG